MYRLAYNIPFGVIILLFIIFFIIWCSTKMLLKKKKRILWRDIQILLLIVCLTTFLSVAFLGRVDTLEQQWPQIFWSYLKVLLERNYDYFQEIYLNILSFWLIGLFASELFKNKTGKFTAFFACLVLSILVENLQYYFSLGLAEIDDIISNMLGSILGIISNIYGYQAYCIIIQVIGKWKNRRH